MKDGKEPRHFGLCQYGDMLLVPTDVDSRGSPSLEDNHANSDSHAGSEFGIDNDSYSNLPSAPAVGRLGRPMS